MNEDPTEKLIRELKEENEKLKKRMAAGKIDADFIDEDGDGIDDRGNEFVEKFPLALLTLHSLFFSYDLSHFLVKRTAYLKPSFVGKVINSPL